MLCVLARTYLLLWLLGTLAEGARQGQDIKCGGMDAKHTHIETFIWYFSPRLTASVLSSVPGPGR